MWKRLAVGALMGGLMGGCGSAPVVETSCTGDCLFSPGDASDPVVARMGLNTVPTTDAVVLTVKNGSDWRLTAGLVTFKPIFTVGSVASAALQSYVAESGKSAGSASKLASALGLTLGVDAFEVSKLDAGESATLKFKAQSNAKLSFIARVDKSTDDFVAFSDVTLVGGAPGVASALTLLGYDLDGGAKGTVGAGNGTTGASLAKSSASVLDSSDCPSGGAAAAANLLTDEFEKGPHDAAWPASVGYEGDFNGDWYTDGVSARFNNPRWGQASSPLPAISGFVKALDLCPAAGSTLTVTSSVVTDYSDPTSDATLVVYFFGRGGDLISVSSNHSLRGRNDRGFALYDAAIPAQARRVAIAPMGYFGEKEQGSLYFDRLAVDYEPAGAVKTTTLATDDFSKYGAKSEFGSNQPEGWAEYAGDWYVQKGLDFATLYNPGWSGKPADVETGLYKSFSLGKIVAGDRISARAFVATTFTDPSSFVLLRLHFDSGKGDVIVSDRLGRGWGDLDVRRAAIPKGATSVTVVISAYLGAKETSSLYVDNFSLSTVR